ncbi:MAG: replicative DNA helicase [Micrococcales bacterium]|nr:replicative DNA helicase [Micrococcales bacterium]
MELANAGPASFDRLPPQDLAAERSVLGSMLLSKDALADVVALICGEDFYRPAHEMIFDVITHIYGRGEPVDAVTVSGELTRRGQISRIGGASYLGSLIAEVPTAANAAYYAQIVRDQAVLRRLVDAGTRIAQLGYTTQGEAVDELVNTAQAEVYAVTERGAAEDYKALGEVVDPVLGQIEAMRAHGGEVTGVPTGFAKLDKLTGGLRPGQMVIVAARPAIGKSTLALDFARSAAIHNGLCTIVFSLEMSQLEITQRLISAESGVFLQHLRHGTVSENDWRYIAGRMGDFQEAPLFIDDSANMSLMEIRAKCRRLKQRNNLKLVIIDYLQLMSSGKRVESRQQEVSEFSRALKLLAKELNLPVVAISQLNRSAEQRDGKKPQMSDLRESGSLEQDADLVILLHRPEPKEDEAQGRAGGDAQLIVAKHRNGPTASIQVAFQGHRARFQDMAEDL